MKAAVLDGIGKALEVREVADLYADPDEAVVRVIVASLNRRDLWIRKGLYAGLKFPIVLGSDAVGSVVQVGENVDQAWLGKAVVVDPSLHWGAHETHQDSKQFQILGLPTDGTFAEMVKVPAANLHERPAGFTDHEAAAIPLAGVTAFRAVMRRGALQPGENVLVTGVGSGAATFAVQIAAAAGAHVYVTSSRNEKIDRALTLGARAGDNYTTEGWSKRLKSISEGFDLIIDSAGGDGFSQLIDLARPGGRIVFFGATVGNPSVLESRKTYWKQLSLLGTTMGSPSDFVGMLQFFEEHSIRPVIDEVFPLDQANTAIDSLEDPNRMGKVVLQVA